MDPISTPIRFGDLQPGDYIRADGGFTCIPEGAVLQVQGQHQLLWVACTHCRHYLDGQIDEAGIIIGFVRAG